MELSDAATYFDSETFQDYFDSNVSFDGQVRPFTQSTRSGPATVRRVLSVGPSITIPARRIIKMVASGASYIVGSENEDYWNNEVLRKEYPLIPVSLIASVGDVGQHLADSGLSEDVFVFATYVRRVPLEDESSLFYSGFEIHFSSTETIANDSVLYFGGEYYRVKISSNTDGAGFGMCEAVQLDSPTDTVDYTSKGSSYRPNTDDYPPTVIPNVDIFIEPAQYNFLFTYPAFEDVKAGDKSISVLKSDVATAKKGDLVGTRRVLAVRDLTVYWVLHCR